MATHLVYPVGLSHQTLRQQKTIQPDECMTLHVRAETKRVITALWPAIFLLCSAKSLAPFDATGICIWFLLRDCKEGRSLRPCVFIVGERKHQLTQRKVIRICYDEVKESSWEFLLRKLLSIIALHRQESRYFVPNFLFKTAVADTRGQISSLWNVVNSVDTFLTHFLFHIEALYLYFSFQDCITQSTVRL